ncbi:helix-turn-helix domain-containing protein [Halomarina litorea]|uniref:helix-turn-helix domain-containing protein n=1 Tax=Halomarina litorea TaxID=2961595 RepID=UPI0020C59355|nr:helix-turn-helix domain-containing protein [Halomarina sp. BCD28]
MSVVARFGVPATDFELGEVLTAGGTVDVRLEAATPLGQPLPAQVWVDSEHVSLVEERLDDSSLIERRRTIGALGDETLVAVEMARVDDGFVDVLGATESVVLSAACGEGRWTFEIRFPDFESLSTFYNRCMESDVSLDVQKVRDLTDAGEEAPYGLTDQQRHTLLVALENGYFSIPREATLMDLANQLDISDTAASQRIRRGLATLVASTLK